MPMPESTKIWEGARLAGVKRAVDLQPVVVSMLQAVDQPQAERQCAEIALSLVATQINVTWVCRVYAELAKPQPLGLTLEHRVEAKARAVVQAMCVCSRFLVKPRFAQHQSSMPVLMPVRSKSQVNRAR